MAELTGRPLTFCNIGTPFLPVPLPCAILLESFLLLTEVLVIIDENHGWRGCGGTRSRSRSGLNKTGREANEEDETILMEESKHNYNEAQKFLRFSRTLKEFLVSCGRATIELSRRWQERRVTIAPAVPRLSIEACGPLSSLILGRCQ